MVEGHASPFKGVHLMKPKKGTNAELPAGRCFFVFEWPFFSGGRCLVFWEGNMFKGAKMHFFDKTTSDFDFKKLASL